MGQVFKGAERFWWSDKANQLHSWGLTTALRDRRADFLANYCPTMKVGKVEQRGADTVFHVVNKAGQASSCSITVAPRTSKAGALAITDIGCSPQTGAAELDPATACK